MEQVSKKDGNKIESEYFKVDYRPWDVLDSRTLDCSDWLISMALADITRQEEQTNKVWQEFLEILSKCNTGEDFINLSTFVNVVANIGGYAVEFKSKVNGLINPPGKRFAENYIKRLEKQQKLKPDDLEKFNEKYARLNAALAELKESNLKDDEEVAYLLSKYNELQSDLYRFDGNIDKSFISECDEQIESSISYLKLLYRSMEETKNSSRF